jgi:acetoin utilization deacetylase AcuC-like enzyme
LIRRELVDLPDLLESSPLFRGLWRRARLAAVRAANTLRNAGLALRPPALVVYHPEYASGFREAAARHAFDVRRADRIVDQLERSGVLSPRLVLTPEPVSREDLLRVHPAEFLNEIASSRRLAELLFIDPRDLFGERDLLQPFLVQTGGTVLALERAIVDRLPVFNLGGGFHHAQRDRAEGFCPINDIAVAIRRVQHRRLAQRILVLDLDYHHGNGTALIFADDESVYTLSVHGQTWAYIHGKDNHLDVELAPGTGDQAYLAAIRTALGRALATFDADAVIYLAGADAHEEDDLGDFAVSEEAMLDRDLAVFEKVTEAGKPLAVLLAGGYGDLAWTLPYNFICSVLTGMRIDPTNRPSNIQARYQRIKDSLSPSELKKGVTDIAEEDIEDLVSGRRRNSLFLDYYTEQGLRIALERYGFLGMLRERGFENPLVSTNTEDPDRQILRIHHERRDPDHLLVELVARFHTLVTPRDAVEEGAQPCYRVLVIDWLLMQNPAAEFSLERQRLPGQQWPGLGLGRYMVELLRMMVERLDCSGLMNIPQHYHNAYLYSKQMLFFDPEQQGKLEAMKRDLRHLPLVETSVAIDEGRLRDANAGDVVTWEGRPQVMPVEPELNQYFTRQGYIQAVARARERMRFRLESPP